MGINNVLNSINEYEMMLNEVVKKRKEIKSELIGSKVKSIISSNIGIIVNIDDNNLYVSYIFDDKGIPVKIKNINEILELKNREILNEYINLTKDYKKLSSNINKLSRNIREFE